MTDKNFYPEKLDPIPEDVAEVLGVADQPIIPAERRKKGEEGPPSDASTPMDPENILDLQDVKVYFPITGGVLKRQVGAVKAVEGVSLGIRKGETLGLVGESGCGKSTLGKSILKLVPTLSGKIDYKDGETNYPDILSLSKKKFKPLRNHLQIVFQDPYSSLNPALSIFSSLKRGLEEKGITSKSEQREILGRLFEKVNLHPEYLDRYPNEFSGGQRQRIAIVRALSVDPDFIVLDEAVSALDVSVQAQVLDLLKELKDERGLTYLFISHNLSVVEYIADRIAVMYLGGIVELTDAETLYANPLHPYTQALLSAIPVVDPESRRERIVLEGDVPSPANPPSGCPFHPRCPIAVPECAIEKPELRNLGTKEKEHWVACFLAE